MDLRVTKLTISLLKIILQTKVIIHFLLELNMY